MRRKFTSIGLAVATAVLAIFTVVMPAFAWHANVKQCSYPGQKSVVTNPDESWTQGQFMDLSQKGVVIYADIAPGKSVAAKGGTYDVHWHDANGNVSSETVQITVKSCPIVHDTKAWFRGPCGDPMERVVVDNNGNVPDDVIWHYQGDHGSVNHEVVVPADAKYRSPWRHVIGDTLMWVYSKTQHKRLVTERVGHPGNFGACFMGYKIGISR